MIDPASDAFLRTFAWRQLRVRVLRKYGSRCQCCGATQETGAVIHVDHIKPRKTHPHLALDEDNLQVLCDACNHGKGNWDTSDWRPRDGYFYNDRSGRKSAHLWDGADTLCRQWSHGVLSRPGWAPHDELGDRRVCGICKIKARP